MPNGDWLELDDDGGDNIADTPEPPQTRDELMWHMPRLKPRRERAELVAMEQMKPMTIGPDIPF